MQIKYLSSYSTAQPPSLLRKAGAVVATTAVAGVALMFSAVLLTAMLGIAATLFAYLWWKTRALRRQLREQLKDMPPRYASGEHEAGEVIEGEAIRVDEPASSKDGSSRSTR